MSWGKIDDRFHAHPKLDLTGDLGAGLITRLVSWSHAYGTGGHVTRQRCVNMAHYNHAIVTSLLASLGVPRDVIVSVTPDAFANAIVDACVDAGWLDPVGDGAYVIHDFEHYAHSKEGALAGRSKAAARQARYRGKQKEAVSPPGDADVTSPVTSPTNSVTPSRDASPRAPAPDRASPSPSPFPSDDLDGHDAGASEPEASAPQPETPAAPPPREPPTDQAAVLLAALQAQPSLAAIATPAFATTLLGEHMSHGRKIPWMVAAIAKTGVRLAREAAVSTANVAPRTPEQIAHYVATCCAQAENPDTPKPSEAPRSGVRPARRDTYHGVGVQNSDTSLDGFDEIIARNDGREDFNAPRRAG